MTISMTATAVSFLSVDLSAQRLVIAWPLVYAAMQQNPDADQNSVWAEFAGVALVVAEKTGQVLFRHGLLREDGSIAPEVITVINSLAARKLRELRK